ncbi:MAG: 3',5'-cyclic-nucleotide phosphodiesterase [Planctomycetota bacterium]
MVRSEDSQFLTSFLVDESLVIDAGSIGLAPMSVQDPVRHLFISHSHLDHIASLPLFLENVYDPTADPVTIYCSATTLEAMQKNLFNDVIWPDFIALGRTVSPFLNVEVIESGDTVEVGRHRVTAVDVPHVVDTFGFIVEGDGASIVIASDTAPGEELWTVAAERSNLAGVFLECSFPESMRWLADEAQHLTPSLYAGEIRKIGRPVRNIALHIKPSTRETVVAELESEGLPLFEVGDSGKVYEFPASDPA